MEMNDMIGGLLSGLVVGGLLDLITGNYFFWIIFVIFGLETGLIFDQRKKIKYLEGLNTTPKSS